MGTDFFERQLQAKKRARLLSLLFLWAVLLTAAGVVFVAVCAANVASFYAGGKLAEMVEEQRRRDEAWNAMQLRALEQAQRDSADPQVIQMLQRSVRSVPEAPEPWRWHWVWPKVWAIAGIIALSVMGFAAVAKHWELRRGGSAVAELLGGRLVRGAGDVGAEEGLQRADPGVPGPAGLTERELLNVVEEMAIASGLPMPRVYVLPDEPGINAFAAGFSLQEASVVVTAGALRHLSRDELQAVVAHEFSHILNGDTRLNQRMIVVIFGVGSVGLFGSEIVHALLSGAPEDAADNEGGLVGLAHPIFWLVLAGGAMLAGIGAIGLAIARTIQAATNRQREFLADASAVQFTRNPAALAGALKKIGGLKRRGRLRNFHGGEIAHMCIAPPSFTLVNTHPPLVERVRRLEPGFDGTFPAIAAIGDDANLRLTATQQRVQRELAEARRHTQGLRQARELFAGEVVLAAGALSAAALGAAHDILEDMPQALRAAAHDLRGAQALLLALVPAESDESRRRQLEAAGEIDVGIAAMADDLRPHVGRMADEHRLPLLDIALPALLGLPLAKRRRLLEALAAAVHEDKQLSLREACYYKLIEQHLLPTPPKRRPSFSVAPLAEPASVLLSALAQMNPEPESAFQVGVSRLKLGRLTPKYAPPSVDQFEKALDQLATASPAVLRRILDAAAFTVATDAKICPREHETLRAVAAVLHVPLPPRLAMLESGAASPVQSLRGEGKPP